MMKKLAIFTLFLAGVASGAWGAATPRSNGRTNNTATAAPAAGTAAANSGRVSNNASATANAGATGARAAVRQTTARSAGTVATGVTAGRTSQARVPGVTGARAATPQTTGTVAARAATQKVINNGTSIASATKNVVVSEECQQKYDGCMDSFCMLDNSTGGRCICNNRAAELDAVLEEIEKLDQQSYQMATFGVEKLEMGADAEAAIAAANAAAQSVINSGVATEIGTKSSKRRTLDLSMWDNTDAFDDMNVFGDNVVGVIDGKTGDALHRAANEVCVAQIPECGSELSMLQLMYSQKIRSDCSAYENSLKQQRNSSAQKLAAAEQALRETALEQLRSANKYDLGQCTIEFKKCMQTTGGCGDDFAGCATVVANDNTNLSRTTTSNKAYKIKGAVTTFEIAASTYDVLLAKKPLCQNITNSCVAVKDQVWDTFLREAAPQIKSAELIAENDARQNCIGSISQCFQKACKDSIDPNDPDGSYDMCLSRPETMLNVCKIPLNACGIDTAKATESQIWNFVVARLAAMRVDSCTTQVKECLTADDRCGKNYSKCIGLDTDTIMRMCPYDKLVGCQKVYGEESITGDNVYEALASMVQGVMLNIDNSQLAACQQAADEAMVKVCGDTQNCNGLTVDEYMGARSLEYKICEYKPKGDDLYELDYTSCRKDIDLIKDSELGRAGGTIKDFAGVIDGTIYWENVTFDEETGKLISFDDYWAKVGQNTAAAILPEQRERLESAFNALQTNINNAISVIEVDETVRNCMYGREVQGMKTRAANNTRTSIGERSEDAARYPALTRQMRMIIANSALKAAKDNYYAEYDKLNAKMLQDYAKLGARIAEIQGKNSLDDRRELARQACVYFADLASIPKSPEPPQNAAGKIVVAAAVVVATVFTAGAAGAAGGAIAATKAGSAALTFAANAAGAATLGTNAAVAAGVGAGAAAAAGIMSSANKGGGGGDASATAIELVGSSERNEWNFKETITSTFDWETLNCHKCTRTQNCTDRRNPWFGKKYCNAWSDPVETCDDTQF